MKVDILFSFYNQPQQMVTAILTNEQLDNKKYFFKIVTSCLDEEDKQSLVKISCLIHGASIPTPNHWYMETEGKFWDDEIPQLMKELWGVDSTIIPVN